MRKSHNSSLMAEKDQSVCVTLRTGYKGPSQIKLPGKNWSRTEQSITAYQLNTASITSYCMASFLKTKVCTLTNKTSHIQAKMELSKLVTLDDHPCLHTPTTTKM